MSKVAGLCVEHDTHRNFGHILALSTSLKAWAVPLEKATRERIQSRETKCNVRRRQRCRVFLN